MYSSISILTEHNIDSSFSSDLVCSVWALSYNLLQDVLSAIHFSLFTGGCSLRGLEITLGLFPLNLKRI